MQAVLMDFYEPRTEPKIASDFYQHPYGGVARDVCVTAEQFARFFDVNLDYLEDMDVNCKWFDKFEAGAEVLGYKIVSWKNARPEYRITIIAHNHIRVSELLKIAPYLWEGPRHDQDAN